jgi:hypothetical protein
MNAKILLLILLYPVFILGQTWDYPVKPGTEEWESLKTHSEKVAICQIPIDVLKKISTDDLIEVCLNYPLNFDFYAYNSIKDGIVKVKDRFNGLQELLARKDNFSLLQRRMDINVFQAIMAQSNYTVEEKGKIIHRYTLIETLLSFDEFMDNADLSEILALEKKTISMLEYKESNKNLFSSFANAASALLLGKSIKRLSPNSKFSIDTELFLETGVIKNSQIFPELKQNYENIQH